MQAAVTQMMMQVFLESEKLKCGVVSTGLVDTFKQKEVQREVLAYMSKFLAGHSTIDDVSASEKSLFPSFEMICREQSKSMMEYNNLYDNLISRVPNAKTVVEEFKDDGNHIIFSILVNEYLPMAKEERNNSDIVSLFDLFEEMAHSDDVKIKEVLEFSVLESIYDFNDDEVDYFKSHMKTDTLKCWNYVLDNYY